MYVRLKFRIECNVADKRLEIQSRHNWAIIITSEPPNRFTLYHKSLNISQSVILGIRSTRTGPNSETHQLAEQDLEPFKVRVKVSATSQPGKFRILPFLPCSPLNMTIKCLCAGPVNLIYKFQSSNKPTSLHNLWSSCSLFLEVCLLLVFYFLSFLPAFPGLWLLLLLFISCPMFPQVSFQICIL